MVRTVRPRLVRNNLPRQDTQQPTSRRRDRRRVTHGHHTGVSTPLVFIEVSDGHRSPRPLPSSVLLTIQWRSDLGDVIYETTVTPVEPIITGTMNRGMVTLSPITIIIHIKSLESVRMDVTDRFRKCFRPYKVP